MIEIIEIGRKGFSTPKFHISDLKVVVDFILKLAPEGRKEVERHTGAKIVSVTAIVGQELHRGIRREVLGVLGDEFYREEKEHERNRSMFC